MNTLNLDRVKHSISSFNRIIIPVLFCFSFILSDWMISYFTFSDFIMGISIFLILSSEKLNISKKDLLFNSLLEMFLLIHILLSANMHDDYHFRMGMINLIKISFYHSYVFLMYKYVNKNRLERFLSYVLNLSVVCVLIIGVYITVVISFDFDLPYEFFWTFTRTDSISYLFRGTNDLIRTRSVFSEPAHLGYFLNAVLAINLFGKLKEEKWIYNILIIIGVILTFSYSSIGVLLILIVIKLIYSFNHLRKLGRKLVFPIIIIGLVIMVFSEQLNETLIERTMVILEGEDGSFLDRVYNVWRYVDRDRLFLGNGLGNTPPLQNVYAYMLSDLGLVTFVLSILITLLLILLNPGLGFAFIGLNFQKGGYLSPAFSSIVLLFILYLEVHSEKLKFWK